MINASFAYTPTGEDDMLLQAVEQKIDTMFPVKINRLEYVYHRLESKIRYFEIKKDDRTVYILKYIQKILRNKVFAQDDVCIATYAQVGDTVEVLYHVQSAEGKMLRDVDTPLSFNPGTPNLWKDISFGVFGMKEGERKFVKIPSYPLAADTAGGSLIVTKTRKEVEQQFPDEILLGDTIVFGSTKIEGVVLAKVLALDDENITFDFSISGPNSPIYLTLNLDRVNKFCGR